MAYAAVNNTLPPFAWLLLGINLLWVVAYDTEYAMVDRDDDVRIGIRTSALTFGRYDVLAVALCYVLYLAGMAWVGRFQRLGPVYFAGLAVAAGIAVYHVWLIRHRDRARCFRAFLNNHWLGFTIFAAIVLDYAMRARSWPRTW
jgi:4-hydroxybenzoate polyprenyltransferase